MRAIFGILFCTFPLIAAIPALADDKPAPTYSQVRAIFVHRCMSCHDAKEAEGELVMETFESLMKGGDEGVVVIPGKADESLMVQQLEHKKKPFMPPPKKAPALPASEIAVIRAWIDAGAKGPLPGDASANPPATTRPAHIVPAVAVRRPVLSLAYDSKMNVVAAARPGEVEIWSVDQQAVIHRLNDLAGDVNAVAFSSDGTRLFAAGGEPSVIGRIWIWSLPDFKPVGIIEGHRDAVYALAVSADGKKLATGSYDQTIAVWDIESRKREHQLIGHNGAVFGVAFRPDGKVLASVSADRTMKLWDVATGNRLDTRPESQKDLDTVVWSPDGARVAAAGVDNRIRVWKVSASAVEGSNSIETAKFAHEGTILRIAWSTDGKWLLSGADDRTVRVFDTHDFHQKVTFPRQSDWPSALTFAQDDKTAIVGRLDGAIGFYAALAGTEIAAPKPIVAMLSPRGIERGKRTRVKLTGKNLARITGVKIAGASGNITARLAEAPGASEAWAEIESGGDLAPESIDLSVTYPGGESPPLKLHVDDLPQVAEREPNNSPAEAQPLTLPVSVWGAFMPAGDSDSFSIQAHGGQTVVFDVAAKRFLSKSQVQLTLSDAAGRILATQSGAGEDPDPLLAFTMPADGRYIVKVADLSGAGSADNFYRLSVGDYAYVTGTFPLSVAANSETKLQLLGHNLPKNASVTVKSAGEGEANVTLDSAQFRSRKPLTVIVSAMPELVENGPGAGASRPMFLSTPSSVNGRIARPGDAGVFRFTAKANSTYAIETTAARRGSPVDTKLQILYPDGRPVQRLQLRAVRDSNITFRGFDSNAGGARFPNYLEMDLDQFVYINGEVVRLFKYPEGPDSEFGFYTLEGKRRCYFGTTPTAHAVEEKAYVVEPHAPGESLVPNGLPTFPIFYENDDDSDRLAGTDSRLLFTAPADGDYLARVTDTRGFGGDDYVYRLTVRPARPDFSVTLDAYDPNVPAGAGHEFVVKLNRMDGFDGPVRIDISKPPAGFVVSSPLIVQAGQWDARGTLFASADAAGAMPAASAEGLKVTATATIDGRSVVRSLPDLKRPWAGSKSNMIVTLEPFTSPAGALNAGATNQPIVVAPGKLTPAWLRVKRNGFVGPLSFDARNFPHGVFVADIGLSGVQILKEDTQTKIFLHCAPWVEEMDRPVHMRVREVPSPTTPPVMLQVRRNEAAAAAR
ncbi:MAG TPA: c-type cytochrome domain-containing protein [Tepidisphaeraceae bacterium]|jgi:hypothetical protein|nr:c-type cytochrome domain-containing protein [Tepidisphaeraceae bacterium]